MAKTNALSFWFNEDELKEQVAGYSTMKWSKTARGQLIIFFAVLNLLTLAVAWFLPAFITLGEALLEIGILYVPLLFFVYKGHRWAIIGIMVVWTGDKLYGLYYLLSTGGTVIGVLIFLILGLAICWRALQVENARRKTTVN